MGFRRAQWLKKLPTMQEMPEIWVRFLGWEDPLEDGMATHSSTLAWRIPWTEEAGRLQSIGRKESDTTEATEHSFSELLASPQSLLQSKISASFGFLSFFFFFSWLDHTACQMSVPWPRMEPVPHQWKLWILTTRPPGNSLGFFLRKTETIYTRGYLSLHLCCIIQI